MMLLDQCMLKALRNILVYVPSRDFSIVSVTDQVSHPYSRIASTVVPLKKRPNRFLLGLDFQMQFIPLWACQASAFLTSMSFTDFSTQDPRYLVFDPTNRALYNLWWVERAGAWC